LLTHLSLLLLSILAIAVQSAVFVLSIKIQKLEHNLLTMSREKTAHIKKVVAGSEKTPIDRIFED